MDDRNYRFTSSLVAALADLGVTEACITPGSRSSPLAMTLAAHPGIRDWTHLDERSSSFFALGIGKASRRPALVVSTSGTAAAELHPAVVEARYGRVPLVVITADRPSDMWESGAPQTIDQRGLYGSAVLWTHDLDVAGPEEAPPGYGASLAGRLVIEALSGPGPTHLNLRFREPLVPSGTIEFPASRAVGVDVGRPILDGRAADRLAAELSGKRGLIVAGAQDEEQFPAAAAACAATLGFPILADPLSQMRAGSHDRSMVVTTADLLAGAGFLDAATPEVIVRVGALPTSKPLWQWMAAHPEVSQILVDDSGWRDPGASVSRVLRADPTSTLARLAETADPAPSSWAERWHQAEVRASAALEEALDKAGFPTEPGTTRAVIDALPADSLLYAASSMPIRDVDLVMPPLGRPVRIAANRGANGIDGLLSSGMGAAAVWPGPVTVLSGDLSALHDLTALATAARNELAVTLVIINNDGGGIFSFLPQARFPDVFERHFGTPHGLDFVRAAGLFGVSAEHVESAAALAESVAEPPDGPRLLEVRTDRTENVEVHRAIRAAVAAALD